MKAQYLLRFDDICPTMNWEIWEQIEQTLVEHEISPIVAIVPDNQDPGLQVAPHLPDFWQRVRRWRDRRWTIGLHGYQHRYVTDDPGIVGFTDRSEFAGLAFEEQRTKLERGAAILEREGVTAGIWVAPAHSFDRTTIAALKSVGIFSISDGFSLFPRIDQDGMLWVPQQLWRFRWAPFGIWTICLHHNGWTRETTTRFRKNVELYGDAIVSVDAVTDPCRVRSNRWVHALTHQAFGLAIAVKRHQVRRRSGTRRRDVAKLRK
jgi:peptidoglycan/xylan/chitin deacetylase (PgdA/CDA1 family)